MEIIIIALCGIQLLLLLKIIQMNRQILQRLSIRMKPEQVADNMKIVNNKDENEEIKKEKTRDIEQEKLLQEVLSEVFPL